MAETSSHPESELETTADLERQVESLLAEVSATVERIESRLNVDGSESPEIDVGAVLDDSGRGEAPMAAAIETAGTSLDGRPGEDAPSMSDAPSVDDVQAALEAAVAESESSEDDQPAEALKSRYGDQSSLDDELAALASVALDEDLGPRAGEADRVEAGAAEPRPGPAKAAPPETAPPRSPRANRADAARSARAEAPVAPSLPDSRAPAAPDSASDGAGRRWGWLPPKPTWPESYSRWRPLVIAWRYVAWIAPALAALVLGLIGRGLLRVEPRVRHAVAVAATPLSSKERRTRSAIGYLAIVTLFWAACLWAYIAVGRSPAIPSTTSSPVSLEAGSEGERQVAAESNP